MEVSSIGPGRREDHLYNGTATRESIEGPGGWDEADEGDWVVSIIFDRPPNFSSIVLKFPFASRPGVVFAWGSDIYNPSRVRLPKFIQKHEEVHGERQLEMGIQVWWDKYLEDEAFRYWEEVLAHRQEWLCQAKGTLDEHKRKRLLSLTADRLIAPLYSYTNPWIDKQYAINDILQIKEKIETEG